MPRLFAAAPVEDPGVRERLAEAQRLLGSGGRVKWVAPHQLHFTLKFLGEVPEGRIAAAREALSRSVDGLSAFSLTLSGLGAFPRREAARVIWAGCTSGREPLEALAAGVEEAFVAAGFPPEERPFSAHLTLGRVREGGGGRSLSELLAREARRTFGEVVVKEAVLFQSVLGPSGPAYSPLVRALLAGARGDGRADV